MSRTLRSRNDGYQGLSLEGSEEYGGGLPPTVKFFSLLNSTSNVSLLNTTSDDPLRSSLALPIRQDEANPSATPDIVQFNAPQYIVNADEGKVDCEVMRIGNLNGSLSVAYYTEAKSAIPGRHFQHTSGRLEMATQQHSAIISVLVFDEPRWNPVREFKIYLEEPKDCHLGLYLKDARIKVLNATPFPSYRFKQFIDMGDKGIEQINEVSLFFSCLYFMWNCPSVARITSIIIALDQLKNVYTYLKLRIAVYMVDTVFNPDSEGVLIGVDRFGTCTVIALMTILPVLILYFVDLYKMRIDVQGLLKKHMCKSLFKVFMNYDAASRNSVPLADMVQSIAGDASEFAFAYAHSIELIRVIGNLGVTLYFAFEKTPKIWWISILVPVLMGLWCCFRTRVFIDAHRASEDSLEQVVRFAHEMLDYLTVISSYSRKATTNDLFDDKAERHRLQRVPERVVSYNNSFFAHFLGSLLSAWYIVVGGGRVLRRETPLGVYLATLSVVGNLCERFAEVFERVMDVIKTFPTLVSVTCLLNKPLEVPNLKVAYDIRTAETKGKMEKIMTLHMYSRLSTSNLPFTPAPDQLKISLSRVTFAHAGQPPLPGFSNINISCPQGRICSIIGDHGRGRKTLLALLAQTAFPSSGEVFVPSHLRVLTVPADPVIFNLTAWQNLTFGNPEGNNPYRVEAILKALKMDRVLMLVQEDLYRRKREIEHEEIHPHSAEFEYGDNPLNYLNGTLQCEVNLARALIANPEVLILHHPFRTYRKQPHLIEHIFSALTEYRDNHGFQMPPSTRDERRPRTVFYTPDTQMEETLADLSWVLPQSDHEEIKVQWSY